MIEVNMKPLQRQMLDDVFDAFTMLTDGAMCSLMHVEGGYTRYTPSAVELFGLPGEYIPNGAMNWNDYLHPEDRKRYMDVMIPLLEGNLQTYDITYRVMTSKGEYEVIRAVGAVLRDSNGKPGMIGGALFNEGLTNRVDPVTVLANKNAFKEEVAKTIREGRGTYALQVGISQLAELNKKHGYSYGNRILQEMAWLIQEAVGSRGSVYRLEGANFAILSDVMTRENMAALYDHIRYQLQRGIEINGINNILTANGGLISMFSSNSNAETICTCLNYAYDESQNNMHGELVDFNGSMSHGQNESLEMIGVIRDCISDGCRGFHLEYLPVISTQTEEITGVECKVYWEDERYGRVQSDEFLPILEHDFIFEELSDFILQQGLSDGVKFLQKAPNFYMCLNMHRLQLESDYFVENLLHYIGESGFPSELLSLKFDSACRYIGIENMRKIISSLHEHNILVIIGDFGSGADSIEFLKSEPIDAVSIAKQLTVDIADNQKNRNILRHLAEIAHDYVEHINVVGIDNKELRGALENLPVSTMQGKYFSELLTFDQVIDYLSSNDQTEQAPD